MATPAESVQTSTTAPQAAALRTSGAQQGHEQPTAQPGAGAGAYANTHDQHAASAAVTAAPAHAAAPSSSNSTAGGAGQQGQQQHQHHLHHHSSSGPAAAAAAAAAAAGAGSSSSSAAATSVGVPHAGVPGIATPPTVAERKITDEFIYLIEKSQELFHGLRDLPQYGQKHWHPHFARTFDVYTRLWKFQQQHRQVLDLKYGLKRWEIGEIASKIAQLYYHYYLRTSETSYLFESFVFYEAIRSRMYFSAVMREKKAELAIKKLRYYARFIVVCLLLNRHEHVADLVVKLKEHIEEYIGTFKPSDGAEWQLVLQELQAFLSADAVLLISDQTNAIISSALNHRLPLEDSTANIILPSLQKPRVKPVFFLRLQESILVGASHQQIKFSELTLDMYRMLQALERTPEPRSQSGAGLQLEAIKSDARADDEKNHHQDGTTALARRANPHKYLLYKPTISQLLLFLVTAHKELNPNGVLLLYVSADGLAAKADQGAYSTGGVHMSSRAETSPSGAEVEPNNASASVSAKALYLADILAFTRKPFFVIIDSPNSQAFANMPNSFGQPTMSLMSPASFGKLANSEESQRGSLFTLFLYSPLLALAHISGLTDLARARWDSAAVQLDRFNGHVLRALDSAEDTDVAILSFLFDDFLRHQILRFVLCAITMRHHKETRNVPSNQPQSSPAIPSSVYEQPGVVNAFKELVNELRVQNLYV
ncbi:hypothetical protein CAOG_009760 [Capsaspora owczarzaki ATCC 30864]|uniref:Protein SCAI n=1 Tax=Capsaspora owczarzaki (strain ATCC 30864) TaxID=595528 RepID=A0A0D2WPU4_CAPO3|nr:hypothetical protein CAOG_009760 [Capsaspora owczarzaki ATCC 30864]